MPISPVRNGLDGQVEDRSIGLQPAHVSSGPNALSIWGNQHAYAIFLAMPYQYRLEITSKAAQERLKDTQI